MAKPSCRWLALGLAATLACASSSSPSDPSAAESEERAGDVFPELTSSLEWQLEERRRQAIEGAKKPQSERPELEAPIVEGGLSVSDLPPCFEDTPGARELAPRIGHRALVRRDFQATEPKPPERGITVPLERAGAFVVLRLECVASSEVRTLSPNRFRATIGRIHFFATLDPERSWWNDAITRNEAATLQHEQLHFDIAQLYARELSVQAAEIRRRLSRTGATPDLALQRFQLGFRAFLRRATEDFEQVEQAYDRDTGNGSDPAHQAEWTRRVKQGLGAVQGAVAASGAPRLRTIGELAGRPESLAGQPVHEGPQP